MGRIGRLLVGAWLLAWAGAALAQDGPRLLAGESRVADRWRGLEIELVLSAEAPWRVFTLEAPRRLVVDLRGAGWEGRAPETLIEGDNALGVRFGPVRGGWSRLVVELGRPLEVREAGMAVAEDGARLRLVLVATSEEAFAAEAGAPPEDRAPARPEAGPLVVPPPADGRLVVAIDPGHGGIDPGAERDGLREAHLMLALGLELARAVENAGMVPVMTRDADVFVPLQDRISLARAGGADVLISLHADALEADAASGASIYTLTEAAVGSASEGMVQRHEGGDLIAGLDLQGQEDAIATALMDLARLDTAPRSLGLAETLAEALGVAGAAVNRRPLREANLAVLKAADFPSVLLEAGFLSDAGDRARLRSPEGRAPIVAGIVAALESWFEAEAARARLLRN